MGREAFKQLGSNAHWLASLPFHPAGSVLRTGADSLQAMQPLLSQLGDKVIDDPQVSQMISAGGGNVGEALGHGAQGLLSSLGGALGAGSPAVGATTGAAAGTGIGAAGAAGEEAAATSAAPGVGTALAAPAAAATEAAGTAGGTAAGTGLSATLGGLLTAAGQAAPAFGRAVGSVAAPLAAKVGGRLASQFGLDAMHGVANAADPQEDSGMFQRAMTARNAGMMTPQDGMSKPFGTGGSIGGSPFGMGGSPAGQIGSMGSSGATGNSRMGAPSPDVSTPTQPMHTSSLNDGGGYGEDFTAPGNVHPNLAPHGPSYGEMGSQGIPKPPTSDSTFPGGTPNSAAGNNTPPSAGHLGPQASMDELVPPQRSNMDDQQAALQRKLMALNGMRGMA